MVTKNAPLILALGCSYTDGSFCDTHTVNGKHFRDLPLVDVSWPMWPEIFTQKLNESQSVQYELLNLAKCGTGIDSMFANLTKVIIDPKIQNRIKYVLVGGTNFERFSVLSSNIILMAARSHWFEIWREMNNDTMSSIDWNHASSVDEVLKRRPYVHNWFQQQYRIGSLHLIHSLLVARTLLNGKKTSCYNYLNTIIHMMMLCKSIGSKFYFMQLCEPFETVEDEDEYTQPHMPYSINREKTSDEIFLESDIYDMMNNSKQHFVNFNKYKFWSYDNDLFVGKKPTKTHRIYDKDGNWLDGHPNRLGQETIANHLWSWYEKYPQDN